MAQKPPKPASSSSSHLADWRGVEALDPPGVDSLETLSDLRMFATMPVFFARSAATCLSSGCTWGHHTHKQVSIVSSMVSKASETSGTHASTGGGPGRVGELAAGGGVQGTLGLSGLLRRKRRGGAPARLRPEEVHPKPGGGTAESDRDGTFVAGCGACGLTLWSRRARACVGGCRAT